MSTVPANEIINEARQRVRRALKVFNKVGPAGEPLRGLLTGSCMFLHPDAAPSGADELWFQVVWTSPFGTRYEFGWVAILDYLVQFDEPTGLEGLLVGFREAKRASDIEEGRW